MPQYEIRYRPKIHKIIECILHLAHSGIELSRYKVVKLIYLADVIHLNRYWRPVTYDNMVAMKNGPVPSATYNILKQSRQYDIDYSALPFDFVQRGDRHYIENPKRPIIRKCFSISDIEVLDEVIAEHGTKTFKELYDLTHEHIGYKNAWESRGSKSQNRIRYEDLVDDDFEHKDELVEDMYVTCRHIY